jgi:hypothetical protein
VKDWFGLLGLWVPVVSKKRFPTSSTAEKKAYHVTRAIKLPTPNTKGIELIGKSGWQSDPKGAMDDKLAQ